MVVTSLKPPATRNQNNFLESTNPLFLWLYYSRCILYGCECIMYTSNIWCVQINGKFNNVTTMTANNNEVVAISNIIILQYEDGSANHRVPLHLCCQNFLLFINFISLNSITMNDANSYTHTYKHPSFSISTR